MTIKEEVFSLCILFICFGLYIAPPIRRKEKLEAEKAEELANATAANNDAQDQEYFRYLTQVVQELEKDPHFKEKLANASEEDLKSGKIAEHVDLLNYNVRAKLDEVKRIEVEYQRDLLRKKKNHMSGKERNYWNPIHHENQETFEKDDLAQLLTKHNDMMEERDKKRHKDFKKYELEKEHKRREELKKMSKEERDAQEAKKKSPKQHEKLHEPGHKAQLEEVWEKEDGLDPDSFDPKTFFNLHDKNSDGYLDQFELETLFLTDLDKAYNESDPDMDVHERNEDMERMREHVMKNIDSDKDGLVSIEEFMKETMSEDFDKDEEWKPIVDEEQFTDDDITEYERMIAEEGGEVPNENDFKRENEERKGSAKLEMESVEHHEEVIKHEDSDKVHEEEKHDETKQIEKEHNEQSKNAHHSDEKVEESKKLKAKEEVHKEPQEEPNDKGGEHVSVTEADHKTLEDSQNKETVTTDANNVRSESETKEEVKEKYTPEEKAEKKASSEEKAPIEAEKTSNENKEDAKKDEKKDEKEVTEDKNKVQGIKQQSVEEKKEHAPGEQPQPEEKVEKKASSEEKAPIEAEKPSNENKEDANKEEKIQPSSQKEEAKETKTVEDIENADTSKKSKKETSEERPKEAIESHHDSGKEVIETKKTSNENKEKVTTEEAISQKEEVKETPAERPNKVVEGRPDTGKEVKDDRIETKKESPESDENKNENGNKPSEKKVSETTKENVEVQNEAIVT